jgi:hypothetical protein
MGKQGLFLSHEGKITLLENACCLFLPSVPVIGSILSICPIHLTHFLLQITSSTILTNSVTLNMEAVLKHYSLHGAES